MSTNNNVQDAVLQVITAMTGTLGAEALAQAPQIFAQMSTAPNVAQALVAILQTPQNFAVPIRMHASVLLKQLIVDNWAHDETVVTEHEDNALANAHVSQETFDIAQRIAQLRGLQQEMNEDDKNYLKNVLPSLLAEPILPIRSNIAVSIATIGHHDFPAKWPNLLQGLIQAAQNPDPNLVQGGLLCFNVLLDNTIDMALQHVAPELFKTLVIILQNPNTVPDVRIQALDLYAAYIRSFSVSDDQHEKGFEQKYAPIITPTLPTMLNICIGMVDAPMSMQEPQSCQFNTRGAAMKIMTRLISYFPVTTKANIDTQNLLLDRITHALHCAMAIYLDSLIAPPPANIIDNDVTEGLTFFLNCTIAFIDIMTETTKHFPKFIMNKLDKILPSLCHALLLTESDVETYRDDINVFSVDEASIDYDNDSETLMTLNDTERTSVVRNESNRFIKIAIEKWSKTGPIQIAKLAAELWGRGSAMKQALEQQGKIVEENNNQFWWKFHEAALVLIGRLISSGKGYDLTEVNTTFPINNVVDMIQQIAQVPSFTKERQDEVFLQARAIALLGHCIRHLTTNLSKQLHRLKRLDLATQTQQLLQRCLNMLPVALTQAPLHTQITTAHTISTCNQSFFIIDHCVLYYQCEELDKQFYEQHPALKAQFDHSIKTGEPLQLQQQHVNTIPITFQSNFAQHFPIYMERFCALLQNVQDQGMISIVECILWVFQFFQQWNERIHSLVDSHPYLQVLVPNSNPPKLLPHLQPHAEILTPQLMTNVVSALLSLWFNNSNNQNLAEVIVDIFHLIAELPNNHIESWAPQAYDVLFRFSKAGDINNKNATNPTSPIEQQQSNDDEELSDAGAKMASIGLISIILRRLSPGPFSASTTMNLDPTKQHVVPVITSIQQLQEAIVNTPCSFQPIQISTVIPVEEILNNFLPTVVQIGLTCQDKTLIFGCCAITASILAMYSPYLLQSYGNPSQPGPHPQLFAMIKQLAMILFRTTAAPTAPVSPQAQQSIQDILEVDDRDTPIACRLVSQLLITYKSVIGDIVWKELLNLIILKLCTTTDYQLQYPCTLILARVGIHHTAPLIQYLATECGTIEVQKLVKKGETIKSKKTGRWIKKQDEYETIQQPIFFRTMNVFLQTIDLLSSGYIRRIVIMFLCQCMSDQRCVELLSQLTNIEDELVKVEEKVTVPTFSAKGSMTTRSKGTVTEQWSYCNAVTKMLKLICDRGHQALILNAIAVDKTDEDGLGLFNDNETDSEDENGNEDDNITTPNTAVDNHNNATMAALFGAKTANGLQSGSVSLDELFDMNEDDEDDNNDDFGSDRTDYPESPYDRFYGVDIAPFVTSFIQAQEILMNNNQGPFVLAKEQLTSKQLEQFVALKEPEKFIQQYLQQKRAAAQSNKV